MEVIVDPLGNLILIIVIVIIVIVILGGIYVVVKKSSGTTPGKGEGRTDGGGTSGDPD